ncbi:MAG: hypothetical protein WEA58_03830 [Balneolaceae bacterium]
MKRIYSLILLLSFTLGVIQPVMPMVDFVVTGGEFLELFHSNNGFECPVQDINEIDQECECADGMSGENESLLDTEFYPIPLHVVQFSGEQNLTVAQEGYHIMDEQTLMHFYSKIAPPPRQV